MATYYFKQIDRQTGLCNSCVSYDFIPEDNGKDFRLEEITAEEFFAFARTEEQPPETDG